jgi:hypothetical protein
MHCNRVKQVVVCAAILVIVGPALAGTVIYVDKNHPQANDGNLGTETLPLKTIDRAMAIVQPGDHVYIKGGTSATDPKSIYDRSGKNGLPIQTPGTAASKIVIEAYLGDTVVLEGNGGNNGIDLTYASYHEIRGFIIENFRVAADGSGNKTDILIEDCEFYHTHVRGLNFTYVTNLTMRDVYVHNCWEIGIFVGPGTNILLERVRSCYNSDGRGADGDADGFANNLCENYVCIDCVAIGNGEDGFDLQCNGALINCISQDNTSFGVKLWRRVNDNYAPKKMSVVNCIINGNTGAGVMIAEAAEVHLYNNVIYNNGEHAVFFVAPSHVTDPVNSELANNIMAENGHTTPGYHAIYVGGPTVTIVDADHNLYYQNELGTSGLHSNTNVVNADPQFLSPAAHLFPLRDGSPAIDAGKTVTAVEGLFLTYLLSSDVLDFDGRVRPSGVAWDIGAYERVDVPGNSPPQFTTVPSETLNVNENVELRFQFKASDPDGHNLFFYLASGDIAEGMTIDSGTGVFSWTPTHDQGGTNQTSQLTYNIVVGVTDVYYAEPPDETSVQIVVHNVNQVPSYGGLSAYTLVEGRPWLFGLRATDVDGDTMSYSISGAPSGLALDSATGRIAWTPTTEQVGQHIVELTISDGATNTTQNITLEVLPQEPYHAPSNEANIFYVDASRPDDTGDGQTEETAWKTIAKANNSLKAGQMVLIRAGTYSDKICPGSGSAGAPIVYKAYPGESPVFDGGGSGAPFMGGSYLVFDGFTFRNCSQAFNQQRGNIVIVNCVVENSGYGIYSFESNGLRVEHCRFRNITLYAVDGGGQNVHLYDLVIDGADRGIHLYASATENATIIDSEISNAKRFGIFVNGGSAFIYNTRVHDNAYVGVYLGAKRSFFVNSSVWNTSLQGDTATNLWYPSDVTLDAIILNSVIAKSESIGLYVGSGARVYMQDTTVAENAVQDIRIATGGFLTDASYLPPDPANNAPVLAAIGDQSVSEKALLSFSIAGTDPDGDPLTYSAINLPTGASFSPATRTFAWTPTNNQNGTYQVTFRVSDGKVAVSQTVKIAVSDVANRAPVLAPIGSQSTRERALLSFSVDATDPDGDALTYLVAGLPSGASFANQVFSWTPTVGQAGSYSITFSVSDGESTDVEKITITVYDNSNRPPVLADIGDKTVNENALLSFPLSATDPDGDALTYSATGLPSGTNFANQVFSWIPNYDQAGSYPVTFAVTDGELTDSEQITIVVANISDQTAPSAHDFSPLADAIQAPLNALIALTISDSGLGIDASTVAIRVNGQLVYSGDNSLSESAYGVCRRIGTRSSYRYYYQAAHPFDFNQRVTVRADASDVAHNAMTPASYQFVTEMHSFGRNQPVSSSGDSSGHPAIATDSQGNIRAAWHVGQPDARDIYVAKRGSETQQWDAPLRLTNLDSDQCNPAIAIGLDGTSYVAWQDNRRGNWDVYVSVSTDGATWGDPVRITDSNDNQTNPVIVTDGAVPSLVYVAWEDDGAGNQDIYLASSSTFFASKAITRVTSDPANQTEPALAVGSDGTVYLVWTDQRNGSADIYASSSSASSWANVPIVTGSGHQHNPAIAVEPGTSWLHMVWVDDTSGNLDVVYGASNGLPGSPIAGRVIVDDTTHADQSAPAIVAVKDYWNNTHVYACWQDNRSVTTSGDSDLYFAEIRSGSGGTNILVGDDGVNSDQSDPALGFDGYGQPAILWVDSRDNTLRIYSAGSTYFRPVALASGLITRTAGGRVGPDPASINDDGDVSIQIPASAFDCDVVVSISKIRNPPKFPASCIAGYEIGPSGVQFAFPATVTIPYTGSASSQAFPYWYDGQTGTLSQQGITEITHKTLANGIPVVSFKTTHVTAFYVLESPLPARDGGGGGGCALSHSQGENIAGYFLPYAVLVLFMCIRKWKDRKCTGD